MKTRLKLNPGQNGTKALVDIYGDALVCVRYRYDEESRTRIKTVEIIVEKTDWTPPLKFADDTLVPVQIAYTENDLKNLAKVAGGRWNPEKRVWFIVYGKVKGTELEKHIVLDADTPDGITAKSEQSI
jgi:hypothetical protein